MPRIEVMLCTDRSLCGQLSLIGDDGATICGPFSVAGRSNSLLAKRHGNPSRDPRLPYGDTPTGDYRVLRLAINGQAANRSTEQPGKRDLVVLQPVSGDAALAEANGRYHFCIQGGAIGPNGALRSTAGAFRLDDAALAELVQALGDSVRIVTCCVETDGVFGARAVVDDDGCDDVDPPLVDKGRRGEPDGSTFPLPRRRLLQAGAAASGVAFSGAMSVFTVAAVAPERAFAQTAYDLPGSQPTNPSGGDPIGQIPPSQRKPNE